MHRASRPTPPAEGRGGPGRAAAVGAPATPRTAAVGCSCCTSPTTPRTRPCDQMPSCPRRCSPTCTSSAPSPDAPRAGSSTAAACCHRNARVWRLFDQGADGLSRSATPLVCWRLDRLERNLRHLVILIEELPTPGIVFVSLGEGIDRTTPAGKLQLHSGFPGQVRARQDSRARDGWPPASQDSRQVVEQTTEGADDDRHSWRERADRSANRGRVDVTGRALDRDGPIAHGTIPFHRVTTFAVFRSVLCPQSR